MRTQTATKTKTRKPRKALGTFNSVQKDSIVMMYLSGFLPEEIGPEFGTGPGDIKTILEDRGYKSERYRYSESVVSAWVKMYDKKGMTFAQIAKTPEGASASTVRFHLARRGIKMKHPAFYSVTRGKKKKRVH